MINARIVVGAANADFDVSVHIRVSGGRSNGQDRRSRIATWCLGVRENQEHGANHRENRDTQSGVVRIKPDWMDELLTQTYSYKDNLMYVLSVAFRRKLFHP